MKEISYKELSLNPFTNVGDDWWLVSAGNEERGYNGMTAQWGQLGAIWGRPGVRGHALPTAIVYIRPQRYTKKFMDSSDYFTVSFFDKDKKDALKVCGSKSGRDCDKMKLAELTPEFDGGAVYPKEARLVLKCRKIAIQKMDNAGFVDKSIEQNYASGDYHYVYIGEIEKVLEK